MFRLADVRNILQLIEATITLHNMLIYFNDTNEDLPPWDKNDLCPHPNDVFDVRVGEEIIWDESTNTRAHLLGHLSDLAVVRDPNLSQEQDPSGHEIN